MKNTMKKLLSLFLVLTMTVGIAPLSGLVRLKFPEIISPDLFDFSVEAEAKSYSGTCGENVNWSLDTETGVLNITGTGAMEDYVFVLETAPWYSYCDLIKTINIGFGVTSIGAYAFVACYNLTTVNIANTVTSIYSGAFHSCENLKSITIPESVTSIGNYTFMLCTSLREIEVDSENEFYCSDSYGVLYNKSKTELIQYAVGNENKTFVIPDSVTSIGKGAFFECTSLTTVANYDNVTSIGEAAFGNCTNLTSFIIPDSIERIENSTFEGCLSLTSIEIPDNIVSIEDDAFRGCTSLTSITIPEKVDEIGSGAFFYTGIYNDEDNWDDGVLYISNHLIRAHPEKIHSEYKIKDDTISIADSAFENCKQLEKIEIPDELKRIGNRAFFNCYNLSYINIPDSVEYIGFYILLNTEFYDDVSNWDEDYILYVDKHLIAAIPKVDYGDYKVKEGTLTIAGRAFEYCTGVDSIEIPETVVSIGSGAFSGCSEMKKINIPHNIKIIKKDTFSGCDSLSHVYYNGTEKEWNKITIESGNDDLLNATIHFLGSSCEHEYSSVLTKETTCLNAGEIIHTCSLCDSSYVEIIPALSHTPGESVTENSTGATCTEKGSYDTVVYCTVCNTEISRVTTVTDAIGHSYTSVVTDPTLSSQGYTTYTCSICGNSYKDDFIAALGKFEKLSVSDLAMIYKSSATLNPDIDMSTDIDYTVEYSSSNPSVATVDKDGNVTATGRGEAEITVTVTDEYGNIVEDTCKVTVSFAWWQWLIYIVLFGFIWY